NELKRIPATLVLFETGPRVAAALADLAAELGPRQAAICRELTKLYEEVRRGDLGTLAREAAQADEPRGEIVIVVAPPDRHGELAAGELDALLRQALRRPSVQGAGPRSPPQPRAAPAVRSISALSHSPRSATMTDERPRASQIQVPRAERPIAFRTGISAESRAAAFLIAKGFRILARRWKSPVGEIDIIARRRSLLVFVEVKARETLDDAAWSVPDRQRLRIAAAAEAWLARNADDRIRDIRFDAMLVAPGRIPRHIPAAFDAGG